MRKASSSDVAVERVKFDMQLMENPDTSGVEYQRGASFGTELRQYLLYRDRHKCSYCKEVSNDPILNIEHSISRALGGSNKKNKLDAARVRNVTNILKGKKVNCLKDATAVNATRNESARPISTSKSH
ncbi:RRXRR domain-containing protein [Endozoicomonas sp. 4G]|uniref:RRXRR domain-containing protein n=1 Tax=Endozoicomonas sp. 4G TaxID=2872754 RepID=UPI002078711B|nr:RRXRR domain-containing protein [Endozoicomonas sp. 4G]